MQGDFLRRCQRAGLLLAWVVMAAVVGMAAGCRSTQVYDPYGDEDSLGRVIPPAAYEGRPDSRFVPLERYDMPTTPVVNFNRLSKDSVARLQLPAEPPVKQRTGADFELGPGDVLEVIYQLRSIVRPEAYRLMIQDEVELNFPYTPQFNRVMKVRSDGKMEFPLIADVVVVGKTTQEIMDEIKVEYAKFLREPVLEVRVVKSNNAIEELKRAITTAPRGQSRLEPVRPDGYISLPLIGDVKASGRTVPELSDAIVALYREAQVADIDVTVVLLEVRSPVVYMLGEVNKTGEHIMPGPMDVWQMVALAGGFAPDADMRNVVVARRTEAGEHRYVLDFRNWQVNLNPDDTMMVKRGDVIYVPKAIDRFVYILGEVEKPNRVALDGESEMRASQLLSQGGRILSSANRSKILLLRQDASGERFVVQLDLKAITKPRAYDQVDDYQPRDPVLQPGDVVYVPPSGIGKVNRIADAWFTNGLWAIIPFGVTANYNMN